jgi:hypothetical protein
LLFARFLSEKVAKETRKLTPCRLRICPECGTPPMRRRDVLPHARSRATRDILNNISHFAVPAGDGMLLAKRVQRGSTITSQEHFNEFPHSRRFSCHHVARVQCVRS